MRLPHLYHPGLGLPILCSLLLLLLLPPSPALPSGVVAAAQFKSDAEGFISVAISKKGLVFVKDLLVSRALSSIAALELPAIEKSVKVPFVGGVQARLSNISITGIEVSSSGVHAGESGVVIVASGATVNLSMDWSYSYSTWLIPVRISDKGRASVLVKVRC